MEKTCAIVKIQKVIFFSNYAFCRHSPRCGAPIDLGLLVNPPLVRTELSADRRYRFVTIAKVVDSCSVKTKNTKFNLPGTGKDVFPERR